MKKTTKNEVRCPVTTIASLLSDTWTMLIIHNLIKSKQMRFCEIERALEGISTRTLTLKLKELEEKDILKKNESGYSITKKGFKLKPIIKMMEKLGKQF